MKQLLFDHYGLEVVVIIKLSEKAYRLKLADGNEMFLKYVEDERLNEVYAHLALISSSQFLIPLLNKSGSYLTADQGRFLIVSPWLQSRIHPARHLQLRFYLNCLARLHGESAYKVAVNDGFFEQTYLHVIDQLDDVAKKLDEELSVIERLDYRSPSQWLLLLNNQQFYKALRKSREHIENFKEKTKSMSSLRLGLVYQNFDYHHINISQQLITSTDKMTFAPLIYDISHLFAASYHDSVDLSGLYEAYLHYFPLEEYEREWLMALLLIPVIDFDGRDDLDRIVKITKCLYYLRGGQEVARILTERKKDDNH